MGKRPAPIRHSIRICYTESTPIGGPPIIFRSGRFICSTIRCCGNRLQLKHIKPRLLGHWGTTPGQNFIYVHLNRIIKQYDLDMIYISGPGHGGPAVVANVYLEGTYSEIYPAITQDEEGLKKAFQTILVSRRHSQPCRAGNARIDSRRRRAGLFAEPCVRRGVR